MTAPDRAGRALEPALEQLLALLGALLALVLSFSEELNELRVVLALRVLDVDLEAQGVGQALLGEPGAEEKTGQSSR